MAATGGMTNGAKAQNSDDGRQFSDTDLLDLHEDILDESEDGVRDLISDFAEAPESLRALLCREAEIEPNETDHALNKIPLTAVHRAALLESEVILSVLLNCHPDVGVDLALKGNGYTPLHVATLGGVMTTVNYLTSNGACVNAKGTNGSTPMHMASREGLADIARLLVVRGAAISETDTRQRTPLHHAAMMGHVSNAAFLLKRDADVNAQDDQGQTPLHVAQVKGHAGVTKLLLSKEADVDLEDKAGNTPLMTLLTHWGEADSPDGDSEKASSTREAKLSCLNLLLSNDASVDTRNHLGDTPLHVAARTGHVELINILLEADDVDLDACNEAGRSPLYGVKDIGICELFLEQDADVDISDNEKNTVLHEYARNDDVSAELLRKVVDAGVGVNSRNAAGQTALFCACAAGSRDKLSTLIELGARIDATDNRKRTLLHVAMGNGHMEVAKLLMDKRKISCDAQDSDGLSILHHAVAQGDHEMVKTLVRKMANINLVNEAGKTPATVAAEVGQDRILRTILSQGGVLKGCVGAGALLRAAAGGDLETAGSLLQQGVDINTSDDVNGRTALHAAVDSRASHVTKLFVSQGADLCAKDIEGRTPLHLASIRSPEVSDAIQALLCIQNANIQDKHLRTAMHYGIASFSTDTLAALLRFKADVNICNAEGQTPVFALIRDPDCSDSKKRKKLDLILQSSVESADLNIKDIIGRTALHHAAATGNTDIVGLLLRHEASVDVTDNSGMTPLHCACANGHLAVASQLVEEDAEVNAQDLSGNAAVHMAVIADKAELIEFLVTEGEADINLHGAAGRTALHLAVEKGNSAVCDLLMMQDPDVAVKDDDGLTALHLAARCATTIVIEELIDLGASVNAVSDRKVSPLHESCANADYKVLSLLLSNNANIDAQDSKGNTALHLCSKRGSYDHVDALLGRGAATDIQNGTGSTALHLATANKETDVIELLVANEADPDVSDKTGRSPLHWAVANDNVEGAMILLEQGADVNRGDAVADTALHLATRMRKVDLTLIKAMLRKRGKLDKRNRKDESPADILKSRKKTIDVSKVISALGLEELTGS